MYFLGQLGSPFNVLFATPDTLMDRGPVASQELHERQLSLLWGRLEQ